MVIPSYGATEAKVPDIVDAIVDLTETGSSLRKNGLRILETLLTSYTELIASGPAYADPHKRAAMEDIALLLRGCHPGPRQRPAQAQRRRRQARGGHRDAARAVLAHDHRAGPGRYERGRDRRPQARREHADPGPEGGRRAGHPGDPHLQDRGVAVPPWRRQTARVLPVNSDGRVLLLHGWDPHHPEAPFWFTIGGGAEQGESLRDAATRELREETGIVIDSAALGEPIAHNTVEFSWNGYDIVQGQTFYAVRVESADVTLDGLDDWERATTDKYGWLSAEDLGGDERPADPAIPDLMRAAAASVLDRRP
jgi:8-oxo-dGTP pyrophosphatase MutT (NUDIX family)